MSTLIGGRRAPGPGGMWSDPCFRWFWAAYSMSMVGAATTRVVLPILVFQLTGSASRTALLLAVQVVPYLGFGLLAAAVADRVDRRALMIGANLVNSAALASIPLAATMDVLTVGQVYLAALLSATAFVWADAAYFGVLPAIVGRRRIVAANSVIMFTFQIINVVAPAVAGAVAALLGPALMIWVEVICYLVSAVLLACLPQCFGAPLRARPAGRELIRNLFGDIGEGLRYVRRHPLIWPLTVAGFGSSLTAGAVLGLLVVYGVRQLGLADDDARLGWLFTAGAVGALGAAIVLPWITRRLGSPRVSLLAFAGNLLFLIGLAVSPDLPVAVVMMLAWQGTQSFMIINSITFRQQLTPDRLQGRVNVTARMIAWGGQPFGAAVGGLIADHTSIQTVFLIMALGVAISTAFLWLSPLRRLDVDAVSRLLADADKEAGCPRRTDSVNRTYRSGRHVRT